MEGPEAGTYLTSRLLKLDPQYFEEEVVRRARQARRRGFLLGIASAVMLLALALFVWHVAENAGVITTTRLVLGL